MPVGHYSYDASLTFPNHAWQAVAFVCFLLCITITSGVLARRGEQYKSVFTTFKPLVSTWLCDVTALATFLVTFLFIVINGVLTFGVGTNMSATCDASVVVCVSVFVLSKVTQYLYYLERLFLTTWAKNPSNVTLPPFMARFKAYPWLGGIFIFVFGVPCAILLGFSRDFQLLYSNGNPEAIGCHVFLRYSLAAPIIVWAAIINTYICIAFFLPLKKGQVAGSAPLKTVCKSSIISALISGLSTVINLSTLLILKGEHGIECLLCCSIDVMANALVIAIISDKRGEAYSFPMLHGAENDNRSAVSSQPDAADRTNYEGKMDGEYQARDVPYLSLNIDMDHQAGRSISESA